MPEMPASMGQPQGAAPPSSPGGGMATGSTPASTPSPNRGLEVAAMAKLASIAQQIQHIIPAFPVTSDIAKDMRDVINKLVKHVGKDEMPAGVTMNETMKSLMQQRQMAAQQAAQRSAQAGGGGPPQQSPMPAPPAMPA